MSVDAKFFQPVDVFELSADVFVIQSGPNGSESSSEAVALGSDGDAIGVNRYGRQLSATCSYLIKPGASSVTLPDVGDVRGGYHIDSMTWTESSDNWPTLEITGHKHVDGSLDSGCRLYPTTGYDLSAAFGVATPSQFTVPDTLALTGVTVEYAVNHVDEVGAVGEHIAGDNYDGTITATFSATGTGNITAKSTVGSLQWTLDSTSDSDQSNTTAQKKSFVFKAHVPHLSSPTE